MAAIVYCAFRILKSTSVPADYGHLAFDADGVRTYADFDIFNLVPDSDTGVKSWKVYLYATRLVFIQIGTDVFKLNDIIYISRTVGYR